MTRRDLLRLLLASAMAEAVDVEQLLWVPRPIITVPAMPRRPEYAMWFNVVFKAETKLALAAGDELWRIC